MTCIIKPFTGIKWGWDHFSPKHFADSTDFQLPPQWETQAHPCVPYPCPDTSQNQMLHRKVQENMAGGLRCFQTTAEFAVKTNRGHVVYQPTGGDRRYKAFLSRPPDQSHLTDSADTRTTQSWPAVPVKEGLTCTTWHGLLKTETVIFTSVSSSFSYSRKAIIL